MRRALGLLLALLTALPAHAEERWVTLGAAVTETVFALGAGDRVVGVDGSSLFPAEADALPEVGSHRAVSVEAILGLRPTRVVASAQVLSPAARTQLAGAGIPVDLVEDPTDLEGARTRIRRLALLAEEAEAGEALVARLDAALAEVGPLPEAPSVAFLYARGAGTLLLAGTGTPVEAVVQAAGGRWPATWEGFRPVTAEALVALAPDVLLLTTRGLQSLGGVEGLVEAPGVALTPAGASRRVVVVDDLVLLTLGPRAGEAVRAVHAALAEASP